MTDPISHEFSRARDMPSEHENQETQNFPVGKETETTESGKSFKSRTPIFAVRMHDGGDAALAQLPHVATLTFLGPVKQLMNVSRLVNSRSFQFLCNFCELA